MKRSLFAFTIFTLLATAIGIGANFAFSSQNNGAVVIPKSALKTDAGIKKSAMDDYGGTDLVAFDSSISFRIQKRTHTEICQSFNYYLGNEGAGNYILGYYGAVGETPAKPLTFVYNVTKADGTVEERMTEMKEVSTNSIYDAIGPKIADVEFKANADLIINKGETVDQTSLKVINIFPGVYSDTEKKYLPDYSTKYFLQNPVVGSTAKNDYSIDSFMTSKLEKISFFKGYTSIECSYENVSSEIYQTTLYKSYSTHAEAIANGEEKLRYRFNALADTTYNVVYKDGTVSQSPITGISYFEIKNGKGTIKFLLTDLDPSKVEYFYLGGLTFAVDILYTSTNKTVVASSISTRFGAVRFANDNPVKVVNYNNILIWAAIIYLFVFVGAAVGVYFYRKNRFKNDEYLRVRTKPFIKIALMHMVTIGFIILDFIFILGRSTDLANSFVVFNPSDAYIMFFSVCLIILIGWFIKYYFNMIKAHNERVKNEKLKLNETKADDGTMAVK
jgi:hypothetical protein